MSFTQEDVNALNEAIASGELKVVVDGREVQYRSIKELLEAKRHIEAEIANGQGRRRSAFRGFRVVVDRGIR